MTEKSLTPLKAIRANCLECCDGSGGVRDCDYKKCPLWIYRFGKNPARKGIGGNPRLTQGKRIAN